MEAVNLSSQNQSNFLERADLSAVKTQNSAHKSALNQSQNLVVRLNNKSKEKMMNASITKMSEKFVTNSNNSSFKGGTASSRLKLKFKPSVN